MPYPNRIIDLFKQRNPMFDRGMPTEGDIGPRPVVGPRYLERGDPLAEMFGRDPRDRQRLITGRPRERPGLSLGDPRDKGKREIRGKDPRDRKDPRDPKYGDRPPPGDKEPPPELPPPDGDKSDPNKKPPPLDENGHWVWYPNEGWVWIRDEGDGDDEDYGDYPPWMGGQDPKMWPSRGEDTRALPRGYGMDWFDDLLRHFNWGGSWTDPGERKKRGGKVSTVMSAHMLNIMNRIANQGVLGPEGRKFITSGDKRESQLRRKGLRKEMERGIGKQLGPRGGGAITNMLFNQLDAPDFARREGKASELREFDMKSRMAGVEGLAQMLNFFEAMFKGEQVKSTGGPGALQTIGDVGKIAATVAALL